MTRKDYRAETLILQNFSYQELTCAHFENAILMACDLLPHADFSNSTLITCDCRGADLCRVNLCVRFARSGNFAQITLDGVIWDDQAESIGDPTCIYNAQSPYLRCTVNPSGLCADCEWKQTHL